VSAVDPRLKIVRLAALFGGAALLMLAMLVFADEPRWRDLAWSVGVAFLILALVANRLVAKQSRGDSDAKP
jgi:peptidoglycan/LPS O-acetylase OafA/YrhL